MPSDSNLILLAALAVALAICAAGWANDHAKAEWLKTELRECELKQVSLSL